MLDSVARSLRELVHCRYLALNFPDLLASPVPQSYNEFQEILVVAHRDLIENGQVDSYLQEAKLTKKRWTLITSSDTIQATLRYTLIARLSPEWNAVSCKSVSGTKNGNLLFRGRNFLSEATIRPVDAIQIRVFVADGIAWLGLRTCLSRLPRISLTDLEITTEDIENLVVHPKSLICENRIPAPWVHVIPSLKRGRVTQVSNGFPVDCVFKNYDDLGKHWRKIYGVVLPPLDPSATPIFASVSFLIGSRPFLYPLECLLRTFPQQLRHNNPEQLVLDFVENVRKCFQNGVVVEITGRPVAELVPAGQVNLQEPFPNVQSGSLNELLRRIPPIVNTDEEMTEKVSVPVSNIQPGLHFTSQLSKLARRPLSDLSSNVPSTSGVQASTLQRKGPEKSRSSVPKGFFQMVKNDVAAMKVPGKPRSLVGLPPEGIFRPSTVPSTSGVQTSTLQRKGPEKSRSSVPKGIFHIVQNNVAAKKVPEKPRSLVPPKGIFRPADKVAKKPTERKQQQKSTADLESLFRVGHLKKATVGQLQTWLRENGFESKGRPRKEDLLDRVSTEIQKKQKEIAAANTSANRTMMVSNLQKFSKQPKPSCPSSDK